MDVASAVLMLRDIGVLPVIAIAATIFLAYKIFKSFKHRSQFGYGDYNYEDEQYRRAMSKYQDWGSGG